MVSCFCIVLKVQTFNRISGDDGYVVPPVPIPNTVVKHINAESTWLETAWEDRKLPVTFLDSSAGRTTDC